MVEISKYGSSEGSGEATTRTYSTGNDERVGARINRAPMRPTQSIIASETTNQARLVGRPRIVGDFGVDRLGGAIGLHHDDQILHQLDVQLNVEIARPVVGAVFVIGRGRDQPR